MVVVIREYWHLYVIFKIYFNDIYLYIYISIHGRSAIEYTIDHYDWDWDAWHIEKMQFDSRASQRDFPTKMIVKQLGHVCPLHIILGIIVKLK